MTSRTCCGSIAAHFTEEKAAGLENDLNARGPAAETQLLVDALARAGVTGMTVLDVGAGIGVLTQGLLEAGARSALLVDISKAYLDAAARRLERAQLLGRVEFQQGDITQLSGELNDADIVALDKVICCYPDFRELVHASTSKARRFYAASYPRQRWATRFAIWFENFTRAVRGNPFRAYIHPVKTLEGLIEQNGFARKNVRQTFFWRCVLFERQSP
jgi:magnesium-protoporphyrin O-methyltransferase